VFEEELEASKLRKGGANPVVEIDSNGISHSEFKFSSNQHPLRFTSTGKSSFIAIHTDTPFMKAISPMTCSKRHALSQVGYYWINCTVCSVGQTDWWCQQCYYSGNSIDRCLVCKKCYSADRAAKEAEQRNPAKHSTFLRCLVSCSFSLQLPVNGRANPTNGSFLLSMEVRFADLPLRAKPLQTLLRLSSSEVSRATKRASAYLTFAGHVVATPIAHLERNETSDPFSLILLSAKRILLKAELEEKNKMLNDLVNSIASVPEKTGESNTSDTSSASDEQAPKAESDTEVAESASTTSISAAEFEEQKNKLLSEIDALQKEIDINLETARNFVDSRTPFIRKRVWTVISFNVSPEDGRMATYINGRKCHEAFGLDPADLRLQHKLVVFGGGKLAHSQGGDIRRLTVQGADYTDSQVYDEAFRMMASSSLFTEYISKIQARVRGYIQRLKYSKSASAAAASGSTDISARPFEVFVKFYPSGRSISVEVQGDWTMRRVKEIICDKEGISAGRIHLFCAGIKNAGQEESRTLSDLGINNSDVPFHCVLR